MIFKYQEKIWGEFLLCKLFSTTTQKSEGVINWIRMSPLLHAGNQQLEAFDQA